MKTKNSATPDEIQDIGPTVGAGKPRGNGSLANEIERIVLNGRRPSWHRLPERPELLFFWDGQALHEYGVAPAPRAALCGSLESLVDAVGLHAATSDSAGVVDVQPVLWVSAERVVAVLDDRTRRDVATCPLRPSAFRTAIQAAARMRDQAGLVRFLRIDLAPYGPAVVAVLAAVKNLRWRCEDAVGGVIDVARESLDRSLTRELTGSGDLPERFEVAGPWFAPGTLDAGDMFSLPLVVDVRHSEQKIALPVAGDACSVVERLALTLVAESLDRLVHERLEAGLAERVLVLEGTPGGEGEDHE